MKLKSCLIIIAALLTTGILRAQTEPVEESWPRKIEGEHGTVIIYQPQIESFVDDKLEARAAISVKTTEESAPIFGAMWFDCRVSTDRDERTVALIDVSVSTAKFPNVEQENVDRLIRFVESEIPRWNLVLSLDRLLADLDMSETGVVTGDALNNEPPEIIFTTVPTVLVLIDGDPIWKESGISGLEYVVNTPFFIARDAKSSSYYIKGGDYWYSSMDPETGWQATQEPPKKVLQLADDLMGAEETADKDAETGSPEEIVPGIIVRNGSAELLQSGGEPEYEPIQGTSLLFMKNTDDDILMDIDTQEYYVLISGRWYKSRSLEDGKWTFIPPDKVPEDFANIPSDSEMAGVKSSVAGTQEAREAVLENQIPQTAEISRSDATLEVEYDGKPKFESIGSTGMQYAVNTEKSVLLINGKYYCCDNAVWFESEDPKGPWTVSVSVPSEVQDIPPESPVYNVKYVYIDDYTPSVVYVGYTPGYVHSYVYMGTVYYGTGFYYHPWYGYYYYPRPVTYGYSVHYNPYTGWGFSMTVSRGWFTFSYRSHPGYWGPAGYRNGYHHGYYHGYHHGYNRGAAAGYRAGYQAGQRNNASNNVYRNRSNGVSQTGGKDYNPRNGQPVAGNDRSAAPQQPARAGGGNNVYTDRNGNVYKKEGNNWQTRENGQWKNTGGSTGEVNSGQAQTRDADRSREGNRNQVKPPQQPQTRDVNKPATRDIDRTQQNRSMENMNREANARSRGAERSTNYNQNRQNYQYQRPSGGRPSGGARSGGSGGARRR